MPLYALKRHSYTIKKHLYNFSVHYYTFLGSYTFSHLHTFLNSYTFLDSYTFSPWPTIFTRLHITHFERQNSRPDISILTAYEITPTTILKHVFHEITHEEVYIRIIILKVNA